MNAFSIADNGKTPHRHAGEKPESSFLARILGPGFRRDDGV